MSELRGLLVDFGGVLTTDVFGSFNAFCEAEGLARESVREAFMQIPEARELLVELECGRLPAADFERRFSGLLGVRPDRLIERLFGGMQPEPRMLDAVRRARRAGLRTGLLSNSWGAHYDRALLAELFDGCVISGEVGMRKPEPAIYALAAERMGVEPAQVVFVDDLRWNLEPARELGMRTVHHTDPGETIAELERLLGVEL